MHVDLKHAATALIIAVGAIGGTATVASAATNCAGTGGLYPDDCYTTTYKGSAYHRGEVSYDSGGWMGRVLVKDSASDGGACTYLQSSQKRSDGSWTAYSDWSAVCGGRSATLTPYGFHGSDVRFRLRVGGTAGATVTCVRGSDGSEACR